jgi:hypothetical protein
MTEKSKVVGLDGRRPRVPPADFWVAQVDLRLNQIETYLMRLEWQIWLVLCAVAALVALRVITLSTAV